ncbi:MAG: LuxR C-terminal-related transcriptional regulator [Prolixibacteraceae bacterium]
MTNSERNQITATYSKLLDQQKINPRELDYAAFDKHIPFLKTLAIHGNSGVSVFDLCKKNHLFYSPNFGTLLGYDPSFIQEKGHEFWDSLIHPDDFLTLMENGVSILKLFFQFSPDEKVNYKLINEYRILNARNNYVRIIEQHQNLELDKYGNIWLTLSTIDLSPNQNVSDDFKSVLLNFRTGNIIPFRDKKNIPEVIGITLSKREVQILCLVKEGLLSKEISTNLNISLHTVNTHRQRVLEKLGVNNSMEAVLYASRLGLV